MRLGIGGDGVCCFLSFSVVNANATIPMLDMVCQNSGCSRCLLALTRGSESCACFLLSLLWLTLFSWILCVIGASESCVTSTTVVEIHHVDRLLDGYLASCLVFLIEIFLELRDWENNPFFPLLIQQMQFMLLFSRQGKLRLQKWYVPLSDKEKKKITRELVQTVLARKPKMCSFLEWRDLKIVYKRLFFLTNLLIDIHQKQCNK